MKELSVMQLERLNGGQPNYWCMAGVAVVAAATGVGFWIGFIASSFICAESLH